MIEAPEIEAAGIELEFKMWAMSIITMLLTAGVAFYLRFLAALLKDSKWHLVPFRVRLHFAKRQSGRPHYWKVSDSRAARPILELRANATLNDSERTVF